MSEDFDYIPFKYDWHKNKNTLRYKNTHYEFCKNDKIECHRDLNKEEIPVTSIDDYFDGNLFHSIYGYTTHQSAPLHKEHLWSNVEHALEDESTKIIKKWDPYNGVVCRTFNIPVKNYILKDSVIHKELTWLKWNKQYYNPNYLYTFDGNEDDSVGVLQKYCPLTWKEPEIDNMESMGRRIFSQRKKKNKLVQTRECYYQIDLGSIKHIQSIVTFGKYPSKRPFPRRKYNYNSYYCDTNKPYVNVVEVINDDSFVTNYSVAYKDSQTQKWVYYNEFEGNINSYTAKINPVDIYSRYIRITPLKFVKTKSMMIYVYVSKNTHKNEYDSEDEEMVRYTLVPSNHTQLRYDGYGERCWSPDYFYAQYDKTVRKANIKNMMEDQLENLDNFDL
jgi:hypothetical protein